MKHLHFEWTYMGETYVIDGDCEMIENGVAVENLHIDAKDVDDCDFEEKFINYVNRACRAEFLTWAGK